MLLSAAGPHTGGTMQESEGFIPPSLLDSSSPQAVVELDDEALSQVAGSMVVPDGPGANW